MEHDTAPRRSIFYPLGMVGTWSIVGAVVILMGAAQVLTLPQGSGFPENKDFWRPAAPFALVSAGAFVMSRVFSRGSFWRDAILSGSIASGAWSISYFLLLFAAGERLGVDDFVQSTVAPENSYTCTRKADGGMECLNALGEPDPNYSYTVIERK